MTVETRDIILSRQRITKALIRLHGCAGWSAPLLFAYGKNKFSHDGAQIRVYNVCQTECIFECLTVTKLRWDWQRFSSKIFFPLVCKRCYTLMMLTAGLGKPYRLRSNCYHWSSLIRVYTVCIGHITNVVVPPRCSLDWSKCYRIGWATNYQSRAKSPQQIMKLDLLNETHKILIMQNLKYAYICGRCLFNILFSD